MFESNLRLVVALANKYKRRVKTLDFEDLLQEGNLGLQIAVRKFDYSRGYKFLDVCLLVDPPVDHQGDQHQRQHHPPAHALGGEAQQAPHLQLPLHGGIRHQPHTPAVAEPCRDGRR